MAPKEIEKIRGYRRIQRKINWLRLHGHQDIVVVQPVLGPGTAMFNHRFADTRENVRAWLLSITFRIDANGWLITYDGEVDGGARIDAARADELLEQMYTAEEWEAYVAGDTRKALLLKERADKDFKRFKAFDEKQLSMIRKFVEGRSAKTTEKSPASYSWSSFLAEGAEEALDLVVLDGFEEVAEETLDLVGFYKPDSRVKVYGIGLRDTSNSIPRGYLDSRNTAEERVDWELAQSGAEEYTERRRRYKKSNPEDDRRFSAISQYFTD